MRKTKIIATLGPASQKLTTLSGLIAAGVDVVRINMSHGNRQTQLEAIEHTRAVCQELGKEVGIMLDLQGPKLRISSFADGWVELKVGQKFYLDSNCDSGQGDNTRVGFEYKDLLNDVNNGDRLLLDDGRIVMDVVTVTHQHIECKVKLGGILADNKGLNRQGGGLSASALTAKDIEDLQFAALQQVDYIAMSFARDTSEIAMMRQLMRKHKCQARLITKIERVEALTELEDMVANSDAVMVARGDLGVELGFANLPAAQKRIISIAKKLNKPVITATQMMESMTDNSIPTRAEVSDCANAVLDGSDALMLSAETATGRYPVQTVAAMAEICECSEQQTTDLAIGPEPMPIPHSEANVTRALAMGAVYIAKKLKVQAIVCLTETGLTPLLMSRVICDIPIYAISRSALVRGQMTLYRGVKPIDFDVTVFAKWQIIRAVLDGLRDRQELAVGAQVVITRGDVLGGTGMSNSLKIVTVDAA